MCGEIISILKGKTIEYLDSVHIRQKVEEYSKSGFLFTILFASLGATLFEIIILCPKIPS